MSAEQAHLLDTEIIRRFDRRGRVFAPSTAAFRNAGELLARLAVREGWTASAQPSLVHDALLAASCREHGVTLITRDRDFERFRKSLPGGRTATPWPVHEG